MRLHPFWGFVLLFLAMLVFGSLASAGEPGMATPHGYERRNVEGFTVFASQEVLARTADRHGRLPLDVLGKELNDLKRILVPKIVSVLQDVPIWAEWDVVDPNMPNAVAVHYHGSPEALRKAGIDPRKSGCIAVLTLRRLGEIRRPGTALQQVVILHEMAHAVQYRLLGMDNPELEAVFQQAVDRKLYEQVNDRFGRYGRAYARTNSAEYFAEISCAYLDACNYFPFNYSQLQDYDPVGFALVERVWKHPDEFKAGGPKPAAREPTVFEERTAQLKLDRLKAKANEGPSDEVKKGLRDLVRQFPGTAAADEARTLLKSQD
jgi:hypothetical protein